MTLAERLRDEPDYRPYCLNCSTMTRMSRTATGFVCEAGVMEPVITVAGVTIRGRYGCGNSFDVDLIHD